MIIFTQKQQAFKVFPNTPIFFEYIVTRVTQIFTVFYGAQTFFGIAVKTIMHHVIVTLWAL
ncbi:MAG: hypothetical protein K8R25_12995 [Methanosarcinales archaeon]|nr:hypothetical protein [Methanosarcinales archaeon]